ncbi:MAG: phosphoenolpyruvate carboxylase, partial [Anaerolineae bacterium]|nr:phosphoenolpyruvate carboxylase [Anaerolineae bacterium]
HVNQTWSDAMSDLSEYGRVHYRDLVYETEGFLDYWQQATPINELSQLRISSRPAKRKGSGGFAAMRAIPWVFSWMQSRAIIPSWFGVGTAIQRYCDTHENGMETLQSMYKEWRFFDALIRNTELDVAKADMGIAKLYSELVDNVQLREQMFSRISDEHQLTQKMICAVTGQNTLLEYAPALQRSIERRNPYIDPLNFIQVDLLQQLRALPDVDTTYRDLLEQVLGTINGIAAGMKTTG